MAITTNTQTNQVQRNTGNMVSGDEIILKVDPRYATALDAVMVASGSAQVFISTDPNYNAESNGFTEMTPDDTGLQSASHNRLVAAGASWIGLKVTSGTWKMNIVSRKEAFVG